MSEFQVVSVTSINPPAVAGVSGFYLADAPASAASSAAAAASAAAAQASNVAATAIATNLSGRVQFDEFLVSGTWTKPAGAKTVQVILIAPGGGGGSGRRGASGTVCGGGGGGAAGAYIQRTFAASDLSATESVVIGGLSTGGNAVTANDTNGNNGTNGSVSRFGSPSYRINALSGLVGNGGTTSGGAGALSLITTTASNSAGSGSSGGTGTAGGNVSVSLLGPAGGPGGGGISATPAAFGGGVGGASALAYDIVAGAAGVVGGALPTGGTNATAKGSAGQSGGGGAASITAAAQAGANSTGYGAGGSGGGASLNGFASGKGGDGGPGYCLVITTFGMEGSQALQATLDAMAPVALTNSVTNPGPASTANWFSNDNAKWLPTYAASEIRVERLAGATGFTLAALYATGQATPTPPAGTTWQFSIDVKPPVAAHTVDAGSGSIIPAGIALPANVYTRIVATGVGAGIAACLTGIAVTADADPGAGSVYTYLRRAMLVQAPPTPTVPYFDGSSPGARWTGAAGASTSIGPGVPSSIVDLSSVQVLANKRLSPRVTTIVSSATPGPAGDTADLFTITALAANATVAAPTGTPTEGQRLRIRIKDDGTARTLVWNAIYRAGGGLLPTTTVAGKQMHLEFAYNTTDVKWDLLSVGVEGQTISQDQLDLKAPGTLTNLVANPGPSTGTAAAWSAAATDRGLVTYVAGEIRVERIAATSPYVVALSRTGDVITTLPVGTTVQRSIEVKPPVDCHVGFGGHGWMVGGFSPQPALALPAGVWTRVTESAVVTLTGTLYPTSITLLPDGADPGIGIYTYFRKSILVVAPPTPVVPYFDGNSPGARWVGAPSPTASIGPGVPASVVDLSSQQILTNKSLNSVNSDSLVPLALTNSSINPIPTGDSSYWSAGDAAKNTPSLVAGEVRIERIAVSTYIAALYRSGALMTDVPAGTWQRSVEVKPPVNCHLMSPTAAIGWIVGGYSAQPSLALPAGVWTRVTESFIGGVGFTYPTAIALVADGVDPGIGVYTYFRRSMLVQAPPTPVVPYFDGNSPGARWTGVANLSASVGPGLPASIVDLSSAQTLANKRVTPRVTTVASSATPTPTGDTGDLFTVTALAANATFAAPTGTPTDGQPLRIRIEDNGTARTLAWNAIYRAGGGLLPLTTVAGKQMYLDFAYNATDVKWDLLSLGVQDRGGVDVQTFLADGTWTKPPGVTNVHVVCVGSGASGASGRRGAAGTNRNGGGGGAGANVAVFDFPAAVVPAVVSIAVGAVVQGGAAVTTNDTDGIAGLPGNVSHFAGFLRTGQSGGGGSVGGFSAGGVQGSPGMFPGGLGGQSGWPAVNANMTGGGGGGGGIYDTNAAFLAGNGSSSWLWTNGSTAAGVVDGALPAVGASGAFTGAGGGGGATSLTQAAQAGANGGSYGGGGGGGGASVNGFASGKGGNGGPGIVVVTSF